MGDLQQGPVNEKIEMTEVVLQRLEKYFGDIAVVQELDLTIKTGEFLVLLGPSGCGKSTTLRMIAGLESMTSGELFIGGKQMNNVDPKDRGVAMVFQNYALYPHKTVFENMAMALKLQKVPFGQVERRVGDVAELLGLTEYLQRKPSALSGGQRQRVAIGRAIVRTPDVFLFDEPLSNLDAKLRVKMRIEIQELHDRLGVTTVYVTHDQVEAMTLADRIVIMNKGFVEQIGTPREVYDEPTNEFVAGFIGSPAMNFIHLEIKEDGIWRTNCGSFSISKLPIDETIRDKVKLGIRPEHIEILKNDENFLGFKCQAVVHLDELLGADALISLSIKNVRVLARVSGIAHPVKGDKVLVGFPFDLLHLFDPETGERINKVSFN